MSYKNGRTTLIQKNQESYEGKDKGKGKKLNKRHCRFLSMIRGNVSGRKEAAAGANFTGPPMLIRTVGHSDDVTSFEFQLTWFLRGEIVQCLHQKLSGNSYKKVLLNRWPKGRKNTRMCVQLINSPLQAPCLVILYPETEKQMWSDGSRPVR